MTDLLSACNDANDAADQAQHEHAVERTARAAATATRVALEDDPYEGAYNTDWVAYYASSARDSYRDEFDEQRWQLALILEVMP